MLLQPPGEDHAMKLYRRPVNKRKAARTFRKQASRTKAANLRGLQRGGWRL